MKHSLVTFSINSSSAFTDVGFSNWKKAPEKFSSHSISQAYKEAKNEMACIWEDNTKKENQFPEVATSNEQKKGFCSVSCLLYGKVWLSVVTPSSKAILSSC